MSLKSKIEAVIYASEEPVTLHQLVTLLSEEAQAELDALAALQADLFVGSATGEPAENLPISVALEHRAIPVPGEEDENSDTAQAESANGAEENPDSTEAEKRHARERDRAVRDHLRGIIHTLVREYAESDRGLEIREVAGGFRFGTKPEYHDAVRGFVRSLKPPLKLTLQALETLAVVAYKQPVTAAEISEIRGVDSAGVLGGLLTRKLIQTAGRKQVIGRPMLYKTSKEFLVRFGLRDIQELPSMEEFERMAGELADQEDLPMETTDTIIERANARGDAEHIQEANVTASAESEQSSPAQEAGDKPSTSDEGSSQSDTPQMESNSVSANVGESSPRSEAGPAPQETA